MASGEILCVGELLWDALPSGLFLGGAAFNVACHLRAAGLPVALASRVGADRLGEEARRRVPWYRVDASLLQEDASLPTGFARVAVDDAGRPRYEIAMPVAWDALEADDALVERAHAARALIFGTLPQRTPTTRRTVARLLEGGSLRVLNLNLRPPFAERPVVREALTLATAVKLSEEELATIAPWFDLPTDVRAGAEALAETFACNAVCVTRGPGGAGLWRDGRWTTTAGFEVEVRDSVGSGDAFLAVLVAGLLNGGSDEVVLRHASLMGAYVATQPGAVPTDQPAIESAPPMPPAPPPTRRHSPRRKGR